MKSLKTNFLRKALTVTSALTLAAPIFAQATLDAQTSINSATTIIKGVANPLFVLIQVVIGLILIVFVAPKLVQSLKSPNQESTNHLVTIFVSGIIVIIILQVIKAVFLT